MKETEEIISMREDFGRRQKKLMDDFVSEYQDISRGDVLSAMAGGMFGGYVLTLHRIKNEVDPVVAQMIIGAAMNILQGRDMRTGMTRQ